MSNGKTVIQALGFVAWTVCVASPPAKDAINDASGSDPDVSERLDAIAQPFGARPPLELFSDLEDSDREHIAILYQQRGDLRSRRGLIWALGWVGDASSADLLKSTLLQDFQRRLLTRSEEDVLHESILNIGLLASESDSANLFVREGVVPEFWKKRKTWVSERGDHSIDLLVCYSLQAVGIAGRTDVPALLHTFRARDANYLHRFAGSITQSMFYYELHRGRGKAFLKQILMMPEERVRVFTEWTETPNGREWHNWANECMRGPRPAALDVEPGG